MKRAGEMSFQLVPGRFSTQLDHWCQLAGYQLVWKAKQDLAINNTAIYPDDFEEALGLVLASLESQGVGLNVTLYAKNRVLEVQGE